MNILWKIWMLAMATCYAASGIASQRDIGAERVEKMRDLRSAALERKNAGKNAVKGDFCEVARNSVTDSDIKDALVSATAPTCDYDVQKRCYQRAVALCDGDNARFSRIAVELARERPDRIPWAICALANRGSTEDLPFLYSFTNDLRNAAMAVTSIIYIEGVTSNSMAAAANVMKIGVETPSYRYHVCAAIAHAVKGLSNSADSWRLATATLKNYAKECKEVVISVDKFLVELDPAYETSEDRKSLLHEVAARHLNDYQVEYATNAIEKITVLCRVQEERLQDLENICTYVESDDLNVEDVCPTPDYIIRKYNVTTNDVVQDLWSLTTKYSLSETNEEKRLARKIAFTWIGHYGGTNDLAQLATVMTNSADYAQEAALLSSFHILKHSPDLIPLVRGITTNSCVYSLGLRRMIRIRLSDICTEDYTDMYLNDPVQQARIAAFSLERAAVEQEEPLGADAFACLLNPSYRHSQQRRDNLAALRPPGLTGRRAELYDAAQADAAQGD